MKRTERMRWRHKRWPGPAAEILAAAGILLLGGLGLWSRYFAEPCRVEADCRGYGIDVKQMMEWERQEREGYNGILDMAGWRVENQQTVTAVSTGRKKTSGVVAVCGSASLVYPSALLSGNCELPDARPESGDAENGAETSSQADGTAYRGGQSRPSCILTGELSDALFGSGDTAGELVEIGGEVLTVAGVIDRGGLCLLRAASDGAVEYAAFRMSRRYQAEEKVRQRIRGS